MTEINRDWKLDRINSAHRGENPYVIARMKSGFAVIGDTQFLPGYCVLLPSAKVDTLNDLDHEERAHYLLDMSLLGDAIEKVCKPKRVNYSIYGNTDTYLHAHIFPRYNWEPVERQVKPVWLYPEEKWTDKEHQYNDNEHLPMKERLREELRKRMSEIYPSKEEK
ncbi:HIT family protein [Guptibacillus algicola]|uniref:HIT family protein n=1 Tax=Guptibacillus algicola TaxID=225844 RepID=UPI001CD4AC44|nr:HIT family protein [Alkalihalobacillus algicola]MCA0987523.1 HIT family protein [Alkalihalobacillus algicola]